MDYIESRIPEGSFFDYLPECQEVSSLIQHEEQQVISKDQGNFSSQNFCFSKETDVCDKPMSILHFARQYRRMNAISSEKSTLVLQLP